MFSFFRAEFENPFKKAPKLESNFTRLKFDEEEKETFLGKKEKKFKKLKKKEKLDSYKSSSYYCDSDSSPVSRYNQNYFNRQNF